MSKRRLPVAPLRLIVREAEHRGLLRRALWTDWNDRAHKNMAALETLLRAITGDGAGGNSGGPPRTPKAPLGAAAAGLADDSRVS